MATKSPLASKPAQPAGEPGGFVTEYRHYRSKKLMRARDYGYKAWPFGNNKKK